MIGVLARRSGEMGNGNHFGWGGQIHDAAAIIDV